MLKKVIYSLLLLSITDAAAMGKWLSALSSREDYKARLNNIYPSTLYKQLVTHFGTTNQTLMDNSFYNTDIIPASLKNSVYISALQNNLSKIDVLYMPKENNQLFFFTISEKVITVQYKKENLKAIVGSPINSAETLIIKGIIQDTQNAQDLFNLLSIIKNSLKNNGIAITKELIKKNTPKIEKTITLNRNIYTFKYIPPTKNLDAQFVYIKTVLDPVEEEKILFTDKDSFMKSLLQDFDLYNKHNPNADTLFQEVINFEYFILRVLEENNTRTK